MERGVAEPGDQRHVADAHRVHIESQSDSQPLTLARFPAFYVPFFTTMDGWAGYRACFGPDGLSP